MEMLIETVGRPWFPDARFPESVIEVYNRIWGWYTFQALAEFIFVSLAEVELEKRGRQSRMGQKDCEIS